MSLIVNILNSLFSDDIIHVQFFFQLSMRLDLKKNNKTNNNKKNNIKLAQLANIFLTRAKDKWLANLLVNQVT